MCLTLNERICLQLQFDTCIVKDSSYSSREDEYNDMQSCNFEVASFAEKYKTM